MPTRATTGSAGYDLYACLDEAVTIAPQERATIHTGIALGIDQANIVALIYARSGLACKHGIVPANCVGVVDSDYRGEVMVVLHNQSATPFVVHHGDRIAQMVLSPVLLPTLTLVDSLDQTTRADGGFGSTGIGETHGH